MANDCERREPAIQFDWQIYHASQVALFLTCHLFSFLLFNEQSTSATTPCIAFVRENKLPGSDEFDPQFSIQIQDIQELKKLGGLGWKTKLVVGGLLGMEVIDGMTLVTPQGETVLTALPRRDELFNRLIALSQNVSFLILYLVT
jgi:hypothetical protein